MTKLTRRTTTGLLLAGSLMPGAVFAQAKKKKRKKKYERPPVKYPDLAKLLIALSLEKLGPGFDGTLSVLALDAYVVDGRDSVCESNRALKASGRKERHCRKGVDYKTDQGKIVFETVVRMTWPPGMRQRPVVSLGETEEDAFFGPGRRHSRHV